VTSSPDADTVGVAAFAANAAAASTRVALDVSVRTTFPTFQRPTKSAQTVAGSACGGAAASAWLSGTFTAPVVTIVPTT